MVDSQVCRFQRTREHYKVTKKMKKQKRKNTTSAGAGRWSVQIAGLVIVVFLVFYPNIGPLPKIGPFPAGARPAIDTATAIPFIPADAWCQTCDWLRDNTPEPFGDPGFYYKEYGNPEPGDGYAFPDSAYSVAVWWDYGYWVTRMGHRIPTCNPGSGGRLTTAKLLTAQTEKAANKRINKLNSGYIIVDFDTATVKFYAVAGYAGLEESRFFDMYFKEMENGMLRGDYYFHPEYYNSLAVRLYNFDGQALEPDKTTVISYEDRISDGEPYKYITSIQTFSNYKAATEFIDNQSSGNYRIVGTDPFESPIPLKALKQYQLVYSSEEEKIYSGGLIPRVKVFEYLGTP
jgi:asparagine N-glycosylation enzyme membrane subunit Stt3